MAIRESFKPGEFCWVDYNAHDMPAALDFYGQLFAGRVFRSVQRVVHHTLV